MYRKRTLLALLTACAVLASLSAGCGESSTVNDYSGTAPQSTESVPQSSADSISEEQSDTQQEISAMPQELTDTQRALLAQNVILTSDRAAQFTEQIAGRVEFPELVGLDAAGAYEDWKKLEWIAPESDLSLVSSLPLDKDAYYDLVCSNTEQAAESDVNVRNFMLTDSDLRHLTDVICDTLSAELDGGYAELLQRKAADTDVQLSNLICTNSLGLGIAAYSDDNIMRINWELAETDEVVSHEMEHLLQMKSPATREAMGLDRCLGFMPYRNDAQLNPLFWSWYFEGAAERLASDLYEHRPVTYLKYISYLDAFSYLAVLDGNDYQAVCRMTQQEDIEHFFAALGADTEEEKLELIETFYAVETAMEASPTDEYYTYYESEYGEVSDDDRNALRSTLYYRTRLVMSRKFYENLTGLLSREQLSFEEVCYLIDVWETLLRTQNRYAAMSDTDKIQFRDDYIQMQNGFFELLGDALGISAQDTAECYEVYCASMPNLHTLNYLQPFDAAPAEDWEGMSVSCLADSENSFLDNMYYAYTACQSDKMIPVRSWN